MGVNGMTLHSQNLLVDCRGGCGKQVDKGKFGELCRACWTKSKNLVQHVAVNDRPQDPTRWHRAQTMCIFCHEQVRTIRAMKLHYHMTDHLVLYDKLTDEQKKIKKIEREEAIKYDQYEGCERTPWF